MTDAKFLTNIISEICNYAVENEMEPDDTIRTIANNLLAILEISTFNNWTLPEPPKAMEAAEAPHPAIRAKWINECIMRGTDCAPNAENNPPDCAPARLMSLEELRRSHGHGFEEVSFLSDVQNPEEVVIWECVWLNGRIMMENDSTASAWAGPYAENYGKWGGCRVWSGLPTEQQRMEAPWGESP